MGNYKKEIKLTVILDIKAGDPRLPDENEGRIMRPRRWIKIWSVTGTDAEAFASFCNVMCGVTEGRMHTSRTDDHRVILWDNLRTHDPSCAPDDQSTLYQPKYGPIEYKICDLLLYM